MASVTPSTPPAQTLATPPMAKFATLPKVKPTTRFFDQKAVYPESGGFYENLQLEARKQGFVVTKALAKSLVDSVFARTEQLIASGNSVHIPGVGTVRVVVRGVLAPRTGMKFLPSRQLKAKVLELR
jgi:nucleoid DNA-binding protein